MLFKQFLAHVQRRPHSLALICGEERLTYEQLDNRVLQVSALLADAGVQQGSVIAIALPNSIEFVIATLAIFRQGAIVLPLNVNYTDAEIINYLQRAECKLALADEAQQQRLLKLADKPELITFGDYQNQQAIEPATPKADDAALIMFSSGSTGGAKQVTRSYQNLLAEWQNAAGTLCVTPDDVILCSVPMYHAHGFGNCILSAMLSGACLVITKGEFNPRTVVKALINENVSIYPSATFMLKMLAMMRLKQQPDPQRLRLVFSAGAPLAEEVIEAFIERVGIMPRQLYGSTETGAVAVNHDDAPLNSVGKPIANTEITIVDESGTVVAQGESGEIVIHTRAAAVAYDGMAEESEKTFKNGCYFSGDLGYFDDSGNLFINGRKKKMINVAGLKVDPGEVESVLTQHPNVQEAVVLGKPDGDYGELVKAVMVVSDETSEKDIIEFCKSHLAEYKRPKQIEFRNEIPKSPLGKILRKYL